MTGVDQATSTATLVTCEEIPDRKWSERKKQERRREHYAAMGPNCPNGHPWSENAKFYLPWSSILYHMHKVES
jgi:hypothetical protein